MTREEIRGVLEQVTEEILERMRRNGFKVEPENEESPVRYDPIKWDINNGHCEPWSKLAADRIEGAFPAWVDEFHCVLVYDGRFYDADCPEGVTDVQELPMFARWDEERPEP